MRPGTLPLEERLCLKNRVDIIETEAGLTLITDVPGAAKDALDVTVEKGILSVSAPVSHTA